MKALRRILRATSAAIALLAAVLVGNTLRKTAPPRPARWAPPAPAVGAELVAAHLAAAVRLDTVSHEDPRLDDPQKLAALRALIEATYPRVHASLARELHGGRALLYTWKGSDPALLPALFAAHQDVVPIEPGTEASWEHPPFSGAIAGGYVWGRGTLDDKGPLVCLLEAAESLLAEGFAPRRTILLAFGSDEEVSGEGAKAIAGALAARGARLEYALDEGMVVTEGVVPDVSRRVAVIGLAEKGYVSVELVVEAPGGHSSMPPAETAIGVLASALDRLGRSPMPARLPRTSRLAMEALAPYLPFGKRVAVSNLWLFEPLVLSAMAKQPVTNASVRTTAAPTILQAGVKENVLPSRARAVVNFRILPGDTVDGVLAHVRRAVADPRVRLSPLAGLGGDPPPESPADARAYRLIEATIHRFYPDAVVTPGLVLGATDGRLYASIAQGVYHFAPFVFGPHDRERVHGTNERVAVADLATAVGVYRALMRDGVE